MFSFFAGVALHRLGASGRLARLPRLPFPAAALVLVAILALPLRRFIDPVISDLVVVTFVWPALVAVTMKDAKSTSWRSLADWSGRLSYPIYAIHFPIIAAFAPLVGNQDASVVERYAYAAVALAVSVAAALLVERYIERPVLTRQKRLTKQTPASST
jgi:peptidoglycan/LPS O-acetylase OafA/YrhL